MTDGENTAWLFAKVIIITIMKQFLYHDLKWPVFFNKLLIRINESISQPNLKKIHLITNTLPDFHTVQPGRAKQCFTSSAAVGERDRQVRHFTVRHLAQISTRALHTVSSMYMENNLILSFAVVRFTEKSRFLF